MSIMPEYNGDRINDSRPPVRCAVTEPHEPHRTTFAPATGLPNGPCPGVSGRPESCPDWCIEDHGTDDPSDPFNGLVLHMGGDHTDSHVRKMLDLHPGGGTNLDLRVTRTDNRDEGTVGVPNLYVRIELELTTWEQAAELARTILDGFGYLDGADR
ncbi:hypothetical protein KOI35_04975 [Actinoplanes bogorensis]|uniref:Uncharacterized protein n=1 Tax=Paractinoplanes bogorensis TaxID=1610840 RepID=A0ABS5YHB5_9ACTN|nr:hypothetical protein [Actinoplanes bogorensis]MBU2662855.1 hypothetical protein [Actinoplanes bogorensis]